MKLATILLALLSSTAIACPDLSGKYTCLEADGVRNVEISQTQELGVTTYNLNFQDGAYTVVADSLKRPQTEVSDGDMEVIQFSYKAYCLDQRLIIRIFLDEATEILDQADSILSKSGEGIKSSTISRFNGEISSTETTFCLPRNKSLNF